MLRACLYHGRLRELFMCFVVMSACFQIHLFLHVKQHYIVQTLPQGVAAGLNRSRPTRSNDVSGVTSIHTSNRRLAAR